jgi:hypothetical protein
MLGEEVKTGDVVKIGNGEDARKSGKLRASDRWAECTELDDWKLASRGETACAVSKVVRGFRGFLDWTNGGRRARLSCPKGCWNTRVGSF